MKHDALHETKQNIALEMVIEALVAHLEVEPKSARNDATLDKLKASLATLKADDKA